MTLKRNLLTGLSSLGILALLNGCYFDKQDQLYPSNTCDTSAAPTYSASVAPIISNSCLAGCHADASSGGGYNLSNHAGLSAVAGSGLLALAVHHDPSVSPMPKNLPKLSDCDLAKIDRWIAAGAPNN